jgi:hypothetical protein
LSGSCSEPQLTSGVASATQVPFQAIADALPTFPADRIVIAAPSERSTRPIDDLVSRARERFGLPVVAAEASRPIAA